MGKSIYQSNFGITNDVTLTLNAEERMMICEAICKAAPEETNIAPLMLLSNKIIKGAQIKDEISTKEGNGQRRLYDDATCRKCS